MPYKQRTPVAPSNQDEETDLLMSPEVFAELEHSVRMSPPRPQPPQQYEDISSPDVPTPPHDILASAIYSEIDLHTLIQDFDDYTETVADEQLRLLRDADIQSANELINNVEQQLLLSANDASVETTDAEELLSLAANNTSVETTDAEELLLLAANDASVETTDAEELLLLAANNKSAETTDAEELLLAANNKSAETTDAEERLLLAANEADERSLVTEATDAEEQLLLAEVSTSDTGERLLLLSAAADAAKSKDNTCDLLSEHENINVSKSNEDEIRDLVAAAAAAEQSNEQSNEQPVCDPTETYNNISDLINSAIHDYS
ncbi:Hypothetical predicted protein [Mytilus galloprovincialis]|uniref:Uncharacterized protein n=1 Tax=Mytilus galloprovincialis TaxID=29158 RepID=A0A8B6BIM6_MYTGA|nr:Hypothetical predicted protein [Mytilus galloprovincialis]